MGRAIAEIRHERGLTQEEFAQQAGISRVYLAQIESGRSSSVLEHMLRALRRAGGHLTVSLDEDDATP
ncbi:MAG TPA: helix-turn-helix transcriptional regulator [Candidatus Nitrosotalea sp.]|nr:helix-turn-helix transcriptional regulator [Candidatus Nitrosotalea sp.]